MAPSENDKNERLVQEPDEIRAARILELGQQISTAKPQAMTIDDLYDDEGLPRDRQRPRSARRTASPETRLA